MLRRSKHGRILHLRRPVVTQRPMHLTLRVHDGLPSLRRDEVLARFRELMAAAQQRGLRLVAWALMPNHIHILAVPTSAAALRDAMRYAVGQLARFLNRLWGRRGKVFVERFWSACCRSVRQGWAALNYVLRNPTTAGLRRPWDAGDAYTATDEQTMANDPFLRSFLGACPRQRRALLATMANGPVPFVPLAVRLQPALPGL
jgi:putative transposase